MTKAELKIWMEEAEEIEGGFEYDGCSNRLTWTVFLHKGEYFIVYFCNGVPSEKWGSGGGYIRGDYEPMPVTRREEVITRVFFEHPCGNEAGWYC